MPGPPRRAGRALLALAASALLWACAPAGRASQPAAQPAPAQPATPAAPAAHAPFFAHYYLWWDAQHWRAKLGDSYPSQRADALPAELSADGCAASSAYPGDQLLDVPAAPLGLYSQDDSAVLDQHIRDAAGAGLAGFVVSWAGSGQPDQTADSTAFSRRLDRLAGRVAAYNASHPTPFYLMLGYEGLNNARAPRPTSWISNDLRYFMARYQASPAFQIPYYGGRTVVMLLDSRKLAVADIAAIAGVLSPDQRRATALIGDEHGAKEWDRGASGYFDGDGWYWSDENPSSNPGAFKAIGKLADELHRQGKIWFAPLNGGYNKSNFGVGGSCIARDQGATMRRVYDGNRASAPDGWMYISWNEFYENTYVEPSLRYGRFYLEELRTIAAAN